MEIGDEVLLKAEVVGFDSNPHGSAVKLRVNGFLDREGTNQKPFGKEVEFWVHRLDRDKIVILGKKSHAEFEVPAWLNAPWLTEEYVRKHAWHPVCDDWMRAFPKEVHFQDTSFGIVPWKSRDEFKPGDVIIFCGFQEWKGVEDGYNNPDRFYKIRQEDIDAYRRGERSLLPAGVVVHPPHQ